MDMKEKNLESWEEFEKELLNLPGYKDKVIRAPLGYFSDYLFRGQSNSDWKLETTLDRAPGGPWSFKKYFRLISRAKHEVETLTEKIWELEEMPILEKWAEKYDNIHLRSFPGYEYQIYLRHHGFPSPLLDWTRSPFVAAFFAFNVSNADKVAIYAYQEYGGKGKVSGDTEPFIRGMGSFARSHPRHILQKSEYTVCAHFKEKEFCFSSHEKALQVSREEQDLVWKFTIPARERIKVLKSLDAYNLNAYSLFQSEESLLETISTRELEFKMFEEL